MATMTWLDDVVVVGRMMAAVPSKIDRGDGGWTNRRRR